MSRFCNGLYYVLCVWCGFKAQTFRFTRTIFLFFLSGGKNIFKIYLQKFVDVIYLRIFVEQ